MDKPKIGVIIPKEARERLFSPEDIERLNKIGNVKWTDSSSQLSSQEAVEFLKDYQIGVGSWGTPWPDEVVVNGCPELRLWVHAAGSVRRFFGNHLKDKDITIASCAPAIAENVAEITLGQLIIGLKRTLENAAANKKGKAGKPSNSMALASATIGVIGASQVGRRTIRNLKHFGPRILLYDPFVSKEKVEELGVELMEDLTELCRQSNAVTLHTPALPSTEKMMGADQFKAMPDDCVFVNTARGMCVDEQALIAELEKGRLFAFLDVSSPEPTPDDSPFRKLPNVIYTSHIAGGADSKIGKQAVDDIEAFINGRSPKMAVTFDMLDRIA
ncbi:phosphoglycerate dehydrogenase [Candidatus Poribacteria bacterium]|nr:phosphoglycerate dehydrogenase [Candidatus Poribacteria bacterium]